jgi:hypothetical protein
MLWPALMPLCFPADMPQANALAPLMTAMAGVAVHTFAMLSVTGIMAVTVYRWIGVGILRSAWINMDALWIAALAITGAILLVL